MLVLDAVAGCRSHRETVSHEEVSHQRTVLDSAVTRVDSLSRRDSVSLWWVSSGLSLDVDSIDWHFTWDSAGRMAGVRGKRLVSRRSSIAGQKAASTVQEETHEEALSQRAVVDSLSQVVVEDKQVETQAGWHPGWLEVVCAGVLLALAVGGVIHLREMTERWSKRR
jgi:hypothetical protein